MKRTRAFGELGMPRQVRVGATLRILSVLLSGMAFSASAETSRDSALTAWKRWGQVTGESGCVNDTWAATSVVGAPNPRFGHTAVWTGTEMIIWGGLEDPYETATPLNTGGRYSPATDTWTATSMVDAPSPRLDHTAVWTGTEMIVWGGRGETGGHPGHRYDAIADSWSAISTLNAPSRRYYHTAVWTGTEMIVWGGVGGSDVGRYDPSTDTWASALVPGYVNTQHHAAVWTGTEMIIWGGAIGQRDPVNTGRRYEPTSESWTPTSVTDVPSPRYWHTGIWTGAEMIVWGGYAGAIERIALNTGARFDSATDSWAATRLGPGARYSHTAVWTGTEMIIWGGQFGGNSGGRYDPLADTWVQTTLAGAPSDRERHTAVWTGTEMIVWGGAYGGDLFNTGGRYCASTGIQAAPF